MCACAACVFVCVCVCVFVRARGYDTFDEDVAGLIWARVMQKCFEAERTIPTQYKHKLPPQQTHKFGPDSNSCPKSQSFELRTVDANCTCFPRFHLGSTTDELKLLKAIPLVNCSSCCRFKQGQRKGGADSQSQGAVEITSSMEARRRRVASHSDVTQGFLPAVQGRLRCGAL